MIKDQINDWMIGIPEKNAWLTEDLGSSYEFEGFDEKMSNVNTKKINRLIFVSAIYLIGADLILTLPIQN